MNEAIAFFNALLYFSKQNFHRPYTTTNNKLWFHHKENIETLPLVKECFPNIENLFLKLGIEDLFRHVKFGPGKGSKFYLKLIYS